jgi:hypothetical protein
MENQIEKFQSSVPNLAQPGSGISTIEMIILRLLIKPFAMTRMDLAKALRNLKEGREAITEKIRAFDQGDLTSRILVKRPWFIEDSSRFWSAAMLCNHLGKVNGALAKAIESEYTAKLGPDYNPKDRLKAVKPEIEKNQKEEIELFLLSVGRIQNAAEKKTEQDLERWLIPHPWFGELTHLQWIWFAGFHMKVHAKQLTLIHLGLRSPISAH